MTTASMSDVKNMNENYSLNIREHFPFPTIREKQEICLQAIEQAYATNKKFIIIEAPTGIGKCFRPGTLVLMYDGTVKAVEHVQVGDLVMGDDSTPRKVLGLSNGVDEMFDVTPTKGESYQVNSSHVLSLKVTKGSKTTGRSYHNQKSHVPYFREQGIIPSKGAAVDIPLLEYLRLSKTQRHLLKGYRVGVAFSEQPLPLAPYFLGLWLGDGSSDSPAITTADLEIINYLGDFATEHNVSITTELKPDTKAATYNLVTPRGQRNPLLDILRSLGVINNKHIPQLYLSNSFENRLALLAGLIDSDGSRAGGSGYDFVFKSMTLAQGVTYLCRSLGLAAYLKPCQKMCKNNGVVGDYYRITVSGDKIVSQIPVKVARKRATYRLQKKSCLVTGIMVTPAGRGRFFGFEVDGNHRFLLADFTVVHNSGIAIAAASYAKVMGAGSSDFAPGAYILSPQKVLTHQYMRDFAAMGLKELKGKANYFCHYTYDNGEGMDCETASMMYHETHDGSGGDCSGYKPAKEAFLNSPLGVTNFAKYLTETAHGNQFKNRHMLILDEGHNTENQVLSMASVELNRFRVEEVGITYSSVPFIDAGDCASGLKWITEVFLPAATATVNRWEDDLATAKATGQMTPEMAKLAKKLSGLNQFCEKLAMFTCAPDHRDWIVYSESDVHECPRCGAKLLPGTKACWKRDCGVEIPRTPAKMVVKPLTATLFADDILFSKAEKILILSATILNFTTFMRNLGIDPNDAVTVAVDSEFPIENRRIFVKPVGKMSFNNKKATLPLMAEMVAKIVGEKNPDVKGLVHTHSYENTKYIVNHLRSLGMSSRVLTHTGISGDRDRVVAEHIAREGEPTVLFSPSMTEGLDLKDDLSRFSIITKVPFPFLDNYMTVRKQRDPEYYAWLTALVMVQATGRSNRHKEDKAKHYILDEDFIQFVTRNEKMFPKWWLDSLVFLPATV